MSIDVFLSSNSRDGYAQDVVDLFSKPNGARQQFRYATKWISSAVMERIKSGMYCKKPRAVLCYIDQSTKNVTPLILPVRFAKISAVREHGSTISIVFQLGEFCKFANLPDLNHLVRGGTTELPEYRSGSLEGKYWLLDEGNAFNEVDSTNDQSNWEHLVESYYEMPNSKEDMPFYRFESITEVPTGTTVTPSDDDGDLLFALDGGKRYEVSIYHFHPKTDFPEYALSVISDDGNLVPLNGDTRVLNTRYDQKDYRFASKRIMLGAASSLAFRRTDAKSGSKIAEDFLLGVRVNPSWRLVAGYVTAIAIGFAVPFFVKASGNIKEQWPEVAWAFAGGCAIGIVTLMKDKLRL
jgi:hypothetical protein